MVVQIGEMLLERMDQGQRQAYRTENRDAQPQGIPWGNRSLGREVAKPYGRAEMVGVGLEGGNVDDNGGRDVVVVAQAVADRGHPVLPEPTPPSLPVEGDCFE